MIPIVARYEIRFHWGSVPRDTSNFRSISSLSTPHEHPLRIGINAGPKVPNFRLLIPSLYHGTLRCFAYPLKHPLSEHWGVTLIGPMRYRLRMGYVRFTVHVQQGDAALSE